MLRKTLLVLAIFLLALVLPSFIIIGSEDPNPEIELFLLEGPVHIGLVLPVKNEVVDWEEFIDPADFESHGEWLELGWGDEDFYFRVPSWDDLTLRIAFDALILPGNGIMHVDYLDVHPQHWNARPFKVSKENYAKLAAEIKSRFKTENGMPVLIPNKGYSSTDNFYEAHGTYSLIRTCNVWMGELLAHVGLRRPLWSPTKYGFLYAY